MENVSGWSGKDLIISINSFAGIAMLDLIDESIVIFDVNDVSRSEEVIKRSLFSISNKKQSRMGKVLLLFNIVWDRTEKPSIIFQLGALCPHR